MTSKLSTIIKRIAENDDQSAFGELFSHFSENLLKYSFSIVKDQSASEDIIQDIFLKLWENRSRLDQVNNIAYYLHVATKNASLNYISSINRSVLRESDYSLATIAIHVHTPDNAIITKENIQQIETAINNLPPRSRVLFRLIKMEGLKYKEAAELLDLSVKTVETYMTIAYGQIIKALEVDLPQYHNIFSYKRKK